MKKYKVTWSISVSLEADSLEQANDIAEQYNVYMRDEEDDIVGEERYYCEEYEMTVIEA